MNIKQLVRMVFCAKIKEECIQKEEILTKIIGQIIEDFNSQTNQYKIEKEEYNKNIKLLKHEINILKGELNDYKMKYGESE